VRGYLAVAVIFAVDKGATIAAQMQVTPGLPMLVGVYPGSVGELDLEHPHEVVNVIRRQIQERVAVRYFSFEGVTMGPVCAHSAMLNPPL
jgi:hypothetical protein